MRASIHKYRLNSDLFAALDDVLDEWVDKISMAEAIGILEILKDDLIERAKEKP